jgi:pSer/pThr/pTyr-binding forkhead associated (FHA) protein
MPGAASNQPCLTVLGGPMSGTQFAIEDAVDNILIGADSSCKFCIPLPGVSPIHARIWLDADGATVYDTHSPRGLYVNDDRVNGQAPLKNGDILWLGTPGEQDVVMIQCRLPRAAPAPEPPAPASPPPAPEVPEATLVMAAEAGLSDPDKPPPAASEFFVTVEEESPAAQDLYEVEPEPPPVEVTTVMDGPPADFDEPYLPPPEEPSVFASMPEPAPRPPTLETEFEDETPLPEPPPREPDTIAVAPKPRPEPTPVPLSPTPAKAEPPPPRPPAPSRPAAAPRPAPPAPRPASSPTPVPRAEPAPASSPMRGIVIAIAIVAILVAGGYFVWRGLRPTRTALVTKTPAPAPTTLSAVTLPSAAPATPPPVVETPAPAPPVEEVVTIVKSPSPRLPSPSPSAGKPSPSPKGQPTPGPVATPAGPSPEEQRAQAVATQVAGLLGQADAAAAARPDEAARLYEEVLKLDPQNARASAGKTATQGAAAAARKRFAAGRTSILSAKARTDVSGFESADVQVADAPGRIDFEATPAGVKPGDTYAVKVYFANESRKPIKVKSLSVSTTTNGARSGGPATPRAREIAPGQRILVGEVNGAWKDGTTSWSTDVVLVSERNDSYRNQVSWR